MKLALVAAQPGAEQGTTLHYVQAVIEGSAAQAKTTTPHVQTFYAVDAPTPGRKAPGIKAIRDQRDRLLAEIEAYTPDAVVSLGGVALAALAPAGKRPTLRKEHGRMRWLDVGSNLLPWTPTIEPFRVIRSPDLHRDFSAVIYKALSQTHPLTPMAVDVHVVSDVAELEAALELLEGATVVGVDVETTGLSAWRDDLLGVGIGAVYNDLEGIAVVVPRELLRPAQQAVDDLLYDAIWRRTRRSVGHNLKFDQQFLQSVIGWAPAEAKLGDTLLLAHLLDERPSRPLRLLRRRGRRGPPGDVPVPRRRRGLHRAPVAR
jgi:hypothetical protein